MIFSTAKLFAGFGQLYYVITDVNKPFLLKFLQNLIYKGTIKSCKMLLIYGCYLKLGGSSVVHSNLMSVTKFLHEVFDYLEPIVE